MDKFVSGALSVSVHSCVTYSVVGKNKSTALDEGNMDTYYTSIMRNKLVYNPGTATDTEFEEKQWQVLKGYKQNQSSYLAFAFRLAIELAEAN